MGVITLIISELLSTSKIRKGKRDTLVDKDIRVREEQYKSINEGFSDKAFGGINLIGK